MSRARDFADLAGSADAGGLTGRNLIINGAATIDQRNSGASVTSGFAVDRFEFQENGSAAFTVERSTASPAGFTNSILATVTTAGSATSAQVNRLFQRIEGNNIAHLNFGTSDARAVVLSFWVRSSLTGTYCAALVNGDSNRAYVAEYSISSANTWEYKTIAIEGDTSGTWATGTGIGIQVIFDLGSGSDYNATADTWVSGNDFRTTNQVNFANTSSATWQITGVQLEVGETATPFEHPRSFGDELARCQRYFYRYTGSADDRWGVHYSSAGNTNSTFLSFPVTMRATPTGSVVSNGLLRVRDLNDGAGGDVTPSTLYTYAPTKDKWRIGVNAQLSNAAQILAFSTVLNFDAEL